MTFLGHLFTEQELLAFGSLQRVEDRPSMARNFPVLKFSNLELHAHKIGGPRSSFTCNEYFVQGDVDSKTLFWMQLRTEMRLQFLWNQEKNWILHNVHTSFKLSDVTEKWLWIRLWALLPICPQWWCSVFRFRRVFGNFRGYDFFHKILTFSASFLVCVCVCVCLHKFCVSAFSYII